MKPRRVLAAAMALACAVVAAGCGLGPGEDGDGGASLVVTRDFGGVQVLRASAEETPPSLTAMRLLDRKAEIKTRYGGRFVQSIEGVSGSRDGRRRRDWFFYVNGIESSVGAAEVRVHAGDRIWWDHRDWSTAMRVPAVVGSWPEPFRHGIEGKKFPVRIDCLGRPEACRSVADRFDAAGVPANLSQSRARVGKETLRIVVGPWSRVREDRAAQQIEQGPERSGVFATFERRGDGHRLTALDARGRPVRRLDRGAGLVAAVRLGEQQPTWVVSGTDEEGVDAAIALLDRSSLKDRYAVLAPERGEALPLPAR